ncbi:cysteine synthase A [Tissierella pigra]|uniref:Cysteine synthase n=1 Tax=Tissierella pigra TaxID=2607614 RepID=A0A6N7XM05_9FIRM|nr:cysteine synthase A [Tissierella pigra]MBU5427367.1 cysteine synthase A [Tissierella pigra]MSU03079.1 cysteine synthase A [Tissierella pigra]
MIISNIKESIGNTPIVRLNRIKEEGMAEIFVKIESFNPSGSVKDRASLYMIEAAEREGKLIKGGTIIEPTSGNTGVGLAMIGAAKGYNVILVMPDTMSIERRKLMEAYGAKIILTKGKYGMKGSVELATKLAEENNYFMPNQFENKNNVIAHYETTGIEILKETNGEIHAFVAGVGTGGTISGAGKRLKEHNEGILIVAVQPSKSPVLTGGNPSPHKIQGIGANFVPGIFDNKIVDEILSIDEETAYSYARRLAVEEGILCGISAGSNVAAAVIMAKKLGEGKKVLTIIPDSGERYLSTDLFLEE